MRESRTSGSVRGDRGNSVPYRYNPDRAALIVAKRPNWGLTCRNEGRFGRASGESRSITTSGRT